MQKVGDTCFCQLSNKGNTSNQQMLKSRRKLAGNKFGTAFMVFFDAYGLVGRLQATNLEQLQQQSDLVLANYGSVFSWTQKLLDKTQEIVHFHRIFINFINTSHMGYEIMTSEDGNRRRV